MYILRSVKKLLIERIFGRICSTWKLDQTDGYLTNFLPTLCGLGLPKQRNEYFDKQKMGV